MALKTEQWLAQRIQKMCAKVHWQRIENSVGVGAPDLHGCWKGKDLWFELKIWGGAPTRPAQTIWHLRRKTNGGKSYRLTYHCKYRVLIVSVVTDSGGWVDVDRFPFTHKDLAYFIAAV